MRRLGIILIVIGLAGFLFASSQRTGFDSLEGQFKAAVSKEERGKRILGERPLALRRRRRDRDRAGRPARQEAVNRRTGIFAVLSAAALGGWLAASPPQESPKPVLFPPEDAGVAEPPWPARPRRRRPRGSGRHSTISISPTASRKAGSLSSTASRRIPGSTTSRTTTTTGRESPLPTWTATAFPTSTSSASSAGTSSGRTWAAESSRTSPTPPASDCATG